MDNVKKHFAPEHFRLDFAGVPFLLRRLSDPKSGHLELYGSAGFVRPTGDEPMSDDPDFPTANHALQVLRQARLSRNEVAALKVWDLVHEMAGTGSRTPEVEEAHQSALVAISALAKTLEEEGFAEPALWKAAFGATESWIESCSTSHLEQCFLEKVAETQDTSELDAAFSQTTDSFLEFSFPSSS